MMFSTRLMMVAVKIDVSAFALLPAKYDEDAICYVRSSKYDPQLEPEKGLNFVLLAEMNFVKDQQMDI